MFAMYNKKFKRTLGELVIRPLDDSLINKLYKCRNMGGVWRILRHEYTNYDELTLSKHHSHKISRAHHRLRERVIRRLRKPLYAYLVAHNAKEDPGMGMLRSWMIQQECAGIKRDE
jgi:hypothetical protein